MSNGLGSLVQPVIRTSPIEDSHSEQAKEDQIIDTSLIYLSKPFSPSDHVGPESIIKVEVQVHIPPPPVMDDHFISWFSHLPNTMKGILGDLQFSISVSFIGNEEGNYLKH